MATKLVDSVFLDGGLKQIADGIRAKTGSSDKLAFPQGFVDEVGKISSETKILSNFFNSAGNYNASLTLKINYAEYVPTDPTARTMIKISIYNSSSVAALPVFNSIKSFSMYYDKSHYFGVGASDVHQWIINLSDNTDINFNDAVCYNTDGPTYTIIESTPSRLTFYTPLSEWNQTTTTSRAFSKSLFRSALSLRAQSATLTFFNVMGD